MAVDPARRCATSTVTAQGGRSCLYIRDSGRHERAGAAPIARCPSALEKLGEVEWGAWLDSGTLPVGQIIQRDPFGDGSAVRANLNGDISEGPAARVHSFGVDELDLAGKPALAAYDFMAIARDSWKPWSAGASTDRCHLPLDVLAQILYQMEAIGDLPS